MRNSLKLLSVFFAVNILMISVASAGCSVHSGHNDGMYVGADYVYSNIDQKMGGMDYDYNSAALNVGTMHGDFGVEAFFQESQSETRSSATTKTSGEMRVYGIDVAHYNPVGEKSKFITTAGVANYEYKMKTLTTSSDQDEEIGYRLGAGMLHPISEKWDGRAIARYSFVDHDYIDDMVELSLGVRYNF